MVIAELLIQMTTKIKPNKKFSMFLQFSPLPSLPNTECGSQILCSYFILIGLSFFAPFLLSFIAVTVFLWYIIVCISLYTLFICFFNHMLYMFIFSFLSQKITYVLFCTLLLFTYQYFLEISPFYRVLYYRNFLFIFNFDELRFKCNFLMILSFKQKFLS